ncbi:MAG: hypothetical protein JWN70_5890 [Planctomycetaceae bacterium]|nr:hypothetical protein [Planctomycetaceae bacterium]
MGVGMNSESQEIELRIRNWAWVAIMALVVCQGCISSRGGDTATRDLKRPLPSKSGTVDGALSGNSLFKSSKKRSSSSKVNPAVAAKVDTSDDVTTDDLRVEFEVSPKDDSPRRNAGARNASARNQPIKSPGWAHLDLPPRDDVSHSATFSNTSRVSRSPRVTNTDQAKGPSSGLPLPTPEQTSLSRRLTPVSAIETEDGEIIGADSNEPMFERPNEEALPLTLPDMEPSERPHTHPTETPAVQIPGELPQIGAHGNEGPIKIPLAGSEPTDNIDLTMRNGRVSLVTRNAAVQTVLNVLAEQQGLNLIAADDVTGNISVTLTDVPFNDALNSIVAISGCTWTQQRGIVLVSKIGADASGNPDVQGKVVQVFPLNFVAAADVELTLKGLMSPLGQVFVSQTSPTDNRRTQELVVVEDLPASIARITQYIQQIDQPPRQVLIEAHILQIDLTNDTRHGVNWKYITKLAGQDVTVGTVGFANPLASPAAIFSLSGEKLSLVVEALQTTTDSKTLANPKVIVANGQEARIQIGAKLGYFVTTTTQTSTLQNVNFLNTGVVLRVTPQISNDNRVLLVVRPEISTGKISALGLPETNTTEAETTVLMEDGGGMVIGGLIKESDLDTQDKVPLLGDIWGIGRLFQRRVVSRQRSEIVIVLIPRIAPYTPNVAAADQVDIARATSPLFQVGLQPAPRPFDPRLPDAINNPRRLRLDRLPSLLNNPCTTDPRPLTYYFPSTDEERYTLQSDRFGQSIYDHVGIDCIPSSALPAESF